MNDNRHDSSPTQGTTAVTSSPPPQPSLVRRRIPMGATATVAALLLVALAVGLFAFHSRGGAATAINGGQHSTLVSDWNVTYTAADVLSPTDAWAVGDGFKRRSVMPRSGIISHFDGKQWHIDDNAVFPDVFFSAISMGSASDGWALGSQEGDHTQPAKPFLAHYTGGRWVPQTLNLPNVTLSQIQMLGPDKGWATGQNAAQGDYGPVLLHFQHGVWTPTMFAPTNAALTQAASTNAVSPLAYHVPQSPMSGGPEVSVDKAQFLSDTEGWAIGTDLDKLAVWRYHNGQWQTVLRVPGASVHRFLDIGANSSTDVWVLSKIGIMGPEGFSPAQLAVYPLSTRTSGGTYFLLHFDGHSWANVPADSAAGAPFLDGATWLPKYSVANQKQVVPGLLMNQDGQWSSTTFPKPVNSVLSARKAADGSTLVVAAMGDMVDSQTLQLLRFANGTWSNV